MKKFYFILVAICSCTLVCKAATYSFDDYIYPFGFRTYASPDSKGNLSSVTQYSFESQAFDNYLVEEVYIGIGMMSAKTIYRYHTEENKVISDVQLRQNRLTGSTRYQDKLTLFAFPKDDKPFKWTEIDRGDKYQCTSEYVYVNVSIYNNSSFIKAVKITRDNSFVVGKEKHRVIEKSYWASGYGRLITLINWDGTERTSSKLDVLDYYQEMSIEEYNSYVQRKKEQERKAREAAEAEAMLKKKMEAFKEKTKPKPFEQKYANYQQPIIGIIDAQVNTLDVIGKGPMVITIASSNDVRVEDGAFSASPQIGKSVKEYLLKLLSEGKIQLDTAINPSTNQSVEIPLILKISQIPSFVTKNFYLDYKKGMWYDAQTKEPFYRSSSLENMIYSSADEFHAQYKKAKRITVVVKYIDFNNNLHLKGVDRVYNREK